jgi:hypothetical protein
MKYIYNRISINIRKRERLRERKKRENIMEISNKIGYFVSNKSKNTQSFYIEGEKLQIDDRNKNKIGDLECIQSFGVALLRISHAIRNWPQLKTFLFNLVLDFFLKPVFI